MENVLGKMFYQTPSRPVYVQRNKIRYSWKASWKDVKKGLKLLDEDGYGVYEKKTLGRIMI